MHNQLCKSDSDCGSCDGEVMPCVYTYSCKMICMKVSDGEASPVRCHGR